MADSLKDGSQTKSTKTAEVGMTDTVRETGGTGLEAGPDTLHLPSMLGL